MAGNNNDTQNKGSIRECLYDIRATVVKLATRQEAIQASIIIQQQETKLVREEIAGVHSRVSSVKDDVNNLRIELTTHISFMAGKRFAWKKLTAPIIAGLGGGFGTLLITFWDSITKWIKEL